MGQREVKSPEASMKSKEGLAPVSLSRRDVDSAVTALKKELQSGHEEAFSPARFALGRGVKRKLGECEETALGLPYPQQRQLILDLCLNKLQSCQRRAEPSLHRSVLLANTLRQLQQEMRLEKGTFLPPAASILPPPTPHRAPEACPVSLDCSSVLTDAPPSHAEPRPPDSLFGSFEITNSTSYLTDLPLDDIFEDIDTSMYDSSDIPVLVSPASRGGGAIGGGDDIVKNWSCIPGGTLQLCLTDLSDLDHIMEILVRS